LLNKDGQPCDGRHVYERVPQEVAGFLAERRIAKRRLGRELLGVGDLVNE
jgi:hypothetical protein